MNLLKSKIPAFVLGAILATCYFSVANYGKQVQDVEEGLDGYYDPVNKVMCYWIKGSKATPACLYAEWPIEVEGTGDEAYSDSKERAKNATYNY